MLKTISKIQTVEVGLRRDFGYSLFQRKDIEAAKYGVSDAEMTTILAGCDNKTSWLILAWLAFTSLFSGLMIWAFPLKKWQDLKR